ncbi:RidA family protein [Streptomyces sodiiphilus]|uniref:RidA family protein n=1 Tax=Streptomyces sodiiphilus TaxID=226217 RepID=A0ABP5ARG5_9ACTN
MTVERLPADTPWAQAVGSARAVAAGDRVLVAGTLPVRDGMPPEPGDPYAQARAAFANALRALEPFGLGAEAVVRTRMYLAHVRDVEEVGRAHREVFGETGPAATLVVVSGFVDSRVLVEVELEAFRGAGAA